MPNSSSNAITSSTVSSESAPRSSTNDASGVTSSSSTPNCSTIMLFTLSATATFSSYLHVHPAVDGENLTSNIRRLVRRQETYRRRNVRRRPKSPQRNLRGPIRLRRVGDRLRHVGFDQPRRNHVDRDLPRRHFARERLAEANQSGLRRRVIRLPGVADLTDHRTDCDDPARSG